MAARPQRLARPILYLWAATRLCGGGFEGGLERKRPGPKKASRFLVGCPPAQRDRAATSYRSVSVLFVMSRDALYVW